MAITRITIENFKGIADRVEVDLKPITVLFGANSAGKSTLLQAMLYLRELLERRNADADQLQASGSSIDLGGFQQLVHGHDKEGREVKIGVTVEVSDDGLPVIPVMDYRSDLADVNARSLIDNGLPGIKTVTVEVTVGWDFNEKRPLIRKYSVSLNGQDFVELIAESSQQAYLHHCRPTHRLLQSAFAEGGSNPYESTEIQLLYRYLERKCLIANKPEGFLLFKVPINSRSAIPNWQQPLLPAEETIDIRASAWDDEAKDAYKDYAWSQFILSHLAVGAGQAVLDELKKVCYIGPLRAIPKRNFSSLRSPREDRWADGMAAWDKLYHSATIPDGNGLVLATSEWLSDRLDLGYSLLSRKSYEVDEDSLALLTLERLSETAIDEDIEERLKAVLSEIYSSPLRASLSLYDARTGSTVAPCDIGVGVSQVIPVVVGSMVGDGNTICIEQPELHLHPAVQSRLGDLFIHSAITEDNKRFILESHSEHLMLRLLRRIRETTEEGEADVDYLGAVKPEHISVYYVNAGEHKTEMIPLRISEDGDFLDRWPNGFFEERESELF
ncbi:DUF3696 domain-containing protein [Coraliomargarita sp. SDUM461004]|uniref:DUF3696 domain-containing protein n=1 Tax=Thalassobacterium sedimentorum TaxID=3041258 RepID=A0ABU1AJY0_9BACT|nr:DUF3696 domain-containing protein [Coraliomargarita sp. SDUM461004]MDQ8195120.1 DUF3696 domain-containing protein [Coraliomargarita sp. SDUM461004]